jgi:hypothetical protein
MRSISFLAIIFLGVAPSAQAMEDAFISHGRMPDSTQKIISEIREDDKRSIPLEVAIKSRSTYSNSGPIGVTVTVTNLFEPPLLLNSRLLVNHRLLPGELSFLIIDPNGKRCEIQRLVSPIDLRDEDFVLLERGMSIQRTVDLADFYQMHKKGTYKIRVYYHNSDERIVNNQHAWMGTLVSEPTDLTLQ